MAPREVPCDPHGLLLQSETATHKTGIGGDGDVDSDDDHVRRNGRVRNRARRPHHQAPDTELQAVMEALPNAEPERSKAEHVNASSLIGAIAVAIESLSEI